MPAGITAALPASPVNQPSAAADAAPLPASTSAAVPVSADTSIPAPAPQPADGIRVTPVADALTAPLAPAATLAPVPQGVTSAASAPASRPETAPAANRQAAALPPIRVAAAEALAEYGQALFEAARLRGVQGAEQQAQRRAQDARQRIDALALEANDPEFSPALIERADALGLQYAQGRVGEAQAAAFAQGYQPAATPAQQRAGGAPPAPRVSMSRPGKSPVQRLAEFWTRVAARPGSQVCGPASAHSKMEDIIRDYARPGEVKVAGMDAGGHRGMKRFWNLRFRDENGRPLEGTIVESTDGYVHVDTSGMEAKTAPANERRTKARGGDLVYQAALTYAHNNGLRFRPDLSSVSGIAHQRRLGHLLSNALRHGTTRHIDPRHTKAEFQDVPPDWWREGDDPGVFTHNIALLAELESQGVQEAATRRGVPIDRLRYDPETDTIQDETGRSQSNRAVADTLARLDPATSGVGEKAFLRHLVSQSALRGQAAGPRAALDALPLHLGAAESKAERSSRQLREQPGEPFRVFGRDQPLLHSKPAGNAAAGRVSAREAADGLSKLRATAPAIAQGVQIVPNRSSLNEADYHPDDWASFTGPDATEAFFNPRTGGVIVLTDNLRRREGETPARAAARAILHERIGHAGLAALRQSDPAFEARWNKLMEAVLEDSAVADEIATLHAQGYEHLSDSQLVEEWFARQVEGMTPQQLQALKPTSILGRLWQWLKDTLRKLTGRFSRPDWTAREIKEIMALSRQALERGGPLGTQQDGRVLHAQVGETLRQADRTLIEEAPQSALLNTRASNEHIARAAAATLQAWPATVQAADGTGIDLQIADRGSLAARLWHLIRDEKTQKIDPDKAAWLPRVQETLQNAQVRLVDEQTGNRVYVRKYSGGIQHAIIIRPDGRVEAQQAFTGSLTTQFPLNARNRQHGMLVDWVRPDLENGQGLRQNAPQPTPPGSTVSGPRQGAFQGNANPANAASQAQGRVMQSKRLNPFHAGDAPNWLRSRLRIPANAPWRVQNLTLRSILKGSPLPKELLPKELVRLFTPPCRGCGRRPRIA